MVFSYSACKCSCCQVLLPISHSSLGRNEFRPSRSGLKAFIPAGCATCMTFRHRHFRLSSLIEIAGVEEGSAEVGERKKKCARGMSGEIREQSGPSNRGLLVTWCLYPAGDKGVPTLARAPGKRLSTSADERTKSSPFPPQRRLSDFPGPTGWRASRSSQRLLLNVLHILV